MDRWIRVLLLTAACAASSGCSYLPFFGKDKAADDEAVVAREDQAPAEATNAEGGTPAVVEPTVRRRQIEQVRINPEDFEAGPYVGSMSIEDFGVNSVYGGRIAYHITEDFFAEASLGRTTAGRTSYERLGGGVVLLTPSERKFTYYDLGFGYNLLPGEIFLGRSRALNTSLYVTAGVGSTKFAGDDRFTLSLGAGYRVMVNNWVSMRLDVRDRIFEIDLLGANKTAHNFETTLGFTVFF